jgi:hypothetical protein
MDRKGGTMSTTQEAAADRHPRLAALDRRIDGLQERARRVDTDVRTTANRRVDDLRAREAKARADLRDLRDAIAEERHADLAELDAELCELEHEIEIADAELDAEMADDAEAFLEAGDRVAVAWDAYLDRLDERAEAAGDAAVERLRASVTRARTVRDEARRRIDEARRASKGSWSSRRKEVRQVFDDLDWAADQAAADIARYFE